MDWLIWVIVIVLVVAIVWWLMSRNKASNSTGSQAPAAMEPANTGSVPDPGAVTAGVAGLAGVTNLGKAAAEGSGPTGDVPSTPEAPATPGLTAEEPVIAAPVVEEPVVEEPVVDAPVVDTDAKLHSADAGDVDDWEAAPVAEVTADDVTRADDAADKAEWESSWTDASGTPVHHHEYTDRHSPTLPGAESAAAEDAATEDSTADDSATASGHLAAEEPYGNGSSSTQRDGHPVKAIAATMTYHDEDAADYHDVEADVWFESAAHAEAAGFRPPRRSRH